MSEPIGNLRDFLWSFIKPYRYYFFGILLTLIYTALHTSLIPYLLKLMIDQVTFYQGDLNKLMDHVYMPAIGIILLEVCLVGFWRVHDYCVIKSHPDIKTSLIETMFDYVSQHSHGFFLENFGGSISTKIADMANSTEEILETSEDILKQIMIILIASLMLLTVHVYFGLIIVTWSCLFIIVSLLISKKILPHMEGYAEKRSESLGYVVDALQNIMSARLFSRIPYEQKRLKSHLKELSQRDRKLKWCWFFTWLIMGFLYCIMLTIVIFLLLHLRSSNLISIGSFAFVILLSIAVIEPVWLLTEHIGKFYDAIGICQQALTIVRHPHEIKDKEEAKKISVTQGKIVFKNVFFSYNAQKPFFQNINFTIPSHQKVGIVGFSGAGKSSLINLILRLYDIEKGSITIDDQDIRDVTQDSLRDHIGHIPQDLSLFHRSLLENIRYGSLEATEQEVIEASKKAHLHEFIVTMPEGYHSLIGERGVKLSGGQRQRIAIARAFLKNAPILILDEATNSLDSITETLIQEALKKLMINKTVIVIAHRLSTLLQMDRILVLNKGVIVEDGSHEELLAKNGLYTKMWNAQTEGFLPCDSSPYMG